ncbi:MAG: SDR family NAD(P)-dependent oxidoreductase, partial [Burkholderiaceae bacterium]
MNQGCIIVTGASRGIGAAIAHQLARAGFHIACLSRSGDLPQVEEHAEDVRKRWFALRCDVTSAEQVAAAIGQAATHFGRPIVGLVNNAGLHTDSRSVDLT